MHGSHLAMYGCISLIFNILYPRKFNELKFIITELTYLKYLNLNLLNRY